MSVAFLFDLGTPEYKITKIGQRFTGSLKNNIGNIFLSETRCLGLQDGPKSKPLSLIIVKSY